MLKNITVIYYLDSSKRSKDSRVERAEGAGPEPIRPMNTASSAASSPIRCLN